MRVADTAADAALVATHIAVRNKVKDVSMAQGWRLEKVAGDEDFEEAKKALWLMGVVVKGGAQRFSEGVEILGARSDSVRE